MMYNENSTGIYKLNELDHALWFMVGADPEIFNRQGANTSKEEKWRYLGAHTYSQCAAIKGCTAVSAKLKGGAFLTVV